MITLRSSNNCLLLCITCLICSLFNKWIHARKNGKIALVASLVGPVLSLVTSALAKEWNVIPLLTGTFSVSFQCLTSASSVGRSESIRHIGVAVYLTPFFTRKSLGWECSYFAERELCPISSDTERMRTNKLNLWLLDIRRGESLGQGGSDWEEVLGALRAPGRFCSLVVKVIGAQLSDSLWPHGLY